MKYFWIQWKLVEQISLSITTKLHRYLWVVLITNSLHSSTLPILPSWFRVTLWCRKGYDIFDKASPISWSPPQFLLLCFSWEIWFSRWYSSKYNKSVFVEGVVLEFSKIQINEKPRSIVRYLCNFLEQVVSVFVCSFSSMFFILFVDISLILFNLDWKFLEKSQGPRFFGIFAKLLSLRKLLKIFENIVFVGWSGYGWAIGTFFIWI